ncbi:flavodoxin domain-containing protein [Kineosporia sp. NBRC 101731]|uniref:flavodoxin family protein n=1 Tax=Kineosporia sp. NBRC 101731 TaxID=3032199 RepID=UPI0024A45CF6|nr:flavodoxin domain-containing protein [Kineosporia sp. NBRC 101731]GLY29704.1 flavodoxin [Kineosporia sp. NBRC 101731]
MRALVVYESMFGNTRAVAEAIGSGLSEKADVEVVPVRDVPLRIGNDVDLLVVGGPTHAFGLSRRSSRQQAGQQAEAAGLPRPETDVGLREWLEATPLVPGLPAAVFDTQMRNPFSGSASRPARRALRRLGCDIAPGTCSFYVQGNRGPLVDGELERARAWGRSLAQTEHRVDA